MITCNICMIERLEEDIRRERYELRIFGHLHICFDCIWLAYETAQVPVEEYPEDLKEWMRKKGQFND